MGYEYHGFVLLGEQIAKQLAFGIGVESRGYLVEQHYVSVAKQGASYGYALCLTFAESAALFGAGGVES